MESISQNAFQTVGEGENYEAGPMINMQDLIDVRESYSKKLEDQMHSGIGENDERKNGLKMMLALGGNNASEQ